MDNKTLYSYTALFRTPDEIIHAAEAVQEKGYVKYDVNTPYPVHGMDKAMKLKPSRLPFVSMFFGFSGTFFSLFMMYWMASIDYPVIVGGKPFFSFPAYVPIMFELTVLSAAVMTVIVMLAVFFKLPNLRHPFHDTDYMKAVSSDQYGISIEAEDEKFNEEEIKALFEELGAHKIEPIYFDDEEYTFKQTVFEPKFISLLVIVGLLVSGTTYFSLNKLMNMIPFNWMRFQSKVITQEESTFFSDGFGMRMPVKGTVAREHIPYLYADKPEEAAVNLVNPLPVTKANLELGHTKFNIFCSPCHGYFGEGDSRLRGQFPNPPSLHSEKVRNWKDGRIYHVLMEGQNSMPSYASQLNYNERWAVILYIRVLQRSLNAKETDL
ncbi:MAG: DUF3341 domain-containing protein [Chlorobi bacterium]|nr:DUF3341 domain-containing protein [Chlorobiota bacterium]